MARFIYVRRARSVATNIRWIYLMGMTLGLLVAQPALYVSAHQSPSGCNSNRFNISIIKDRTEVYQGQVLTYTVTAVNVNFNSDLACDITDAEIDVTLPAADGTPTGQVVTLVAHTNFPAGTSTTLIGTAPYTVNVNPGVTDIVAQARAQGTLHDAPVDHSALIVKTLGTTVVAPPTTPPGAPPGTPPGGSGSGSGTSTGTPKLPNTGMLATN